MGAARRSCFKAVVLAGMIGASVGLTLPGCQFPAYGFAAANGGSAGAAAGMSGAPGGALSEGGDDGGDDGAGDSQAGAAGGEPVPSMPCPTQSCVPGVPAGWLGPIAFWEGKAGAPDALPDCPRGYAEPVDLHRELDAPAGDCECTCAAQGQVCEQNTPLHIYVDMTCATECATATPKTCDAISSCMGSQGSLRADTPTPSGGSCKATVSAPGTASWQYDARLCQTNDASTCQDPNQICAPTPPSPYASQLCIMRVIPEGHSLPACPAEYPNGNEALYETFLDSRGCSDCGCGGVTGGSCSGKIVISAGGDCSSGFEYVPGGGCKAFNLGQGNVQPSHVGGQYTVTPGACSVASAAQPTGSATPSGRVTVVCCQ